MGKINSSKEYHLRNRMYQFAENHSSWPKKWIVQHFIDENVPKSTIYDVLRRMENKLPPERKRRVAPPTSKMGPK